MTTSLTILQTLKSLRTLKPLASLAEWHANSMGYRKMGIPSPLTRRSPLRRPHSRGKPNRPGSPSQTHPKRIRRSSLSLAQSSRALYKEGYTSKGRMAHASGSSFCSLTPQDSPYLRPIIEQVELEVATRQNFDNLSVIPEALAKRNRL